MNENVEWIKHVFKQSMKSLTTMSSSYGEVIFHIADSVLEGI